MVLKSEEKKRKKRSSPHFVTFPLPFLTFTFLFWFSIFSSPFPYLSFPGRSAVYFPVRSVEGHSIPPAVTPLSASRYHHSPILLWVEIHHSLHYLKVHGPFFKNLLFVSSEESSLQRWKIWNFCWNCQAIWMHKAILYTAVAYILYCVSLIMVTITRHIFINIFQTKHSSAVKVAMGYEKNIHFLVIAKSPKAWKKLKR